MKFTQDLGEVARNAGYLSLGISIVASVVIGALIGIYLSKWTGISIFFYIFTFFGICAAVLNVYKIYKKQTRELEDMERNKDYEMPKYEDSED